MHEEPQIEVTVHRHYLEVSAEVLADAPLVQDLMRVLDPNAPKRPPPTDPGPNPRHLALVEAVRAIPVLVELVELHQPHAVVYPKADGMAPHVDWHCEGEPPSGYEWDYADWPCETVAVIAHHLGVSVDG